MKKIIILFIIGLLLLVNVASANVFNDTALDNANDIYGQTKELNNLLNGIVGIGFILAIFSITFALITSNTGNMLSGLTAASFWATFTGMVFLPLDLIGFSVFQILLLMFGISLAARTLIID